MTQQLYEHVSKHLVQRMMAHNDIDSDVKKQLKSYLKNYDSKNKGFKVEYEHKGLGIGRLYAKGSLSLQNFKRIIRETLVHDTHTDIDIVNCHLVLLSQYCKKNGLMCECVNDYVDNRPTRLQEIINLYKVSRKVAKDMILVMMYGGVLNNYCADNGFDINTPLPQWVENLNKEMKLLAERISNNEANTMTAVKKLKKKEYLNKETSCLSYVLQVIENDIISKASVKLKQLGIEVDTLCFDGVLVLGMHNDPNLLEELSSHCFEMTGYKVEFSYKPMESHYELTEEAYDFTGYDYKYLEEYNQVYCGTLSGPSPEAEYQLRKGYIEKFLCKVQQPEPMYMFQNGRHKKVEPMNASQTTLLLKPIQISNEGEEDGPPISFYVKWASDLNHRLYRTMDFIPFNINNPIDDPNIFNVFEGFNPDIYGPTQDAGTIIKIITPYLELCEALCGGDDEHAMYFHKFIAQIFQDPSNKPGVSIIFKGKQGTGKNMVLDAIGNMLNNAHYISSSRPNDFFGEHAEGFYRKLLVNLNEAEGKDTFDFEGKIKSFITDPKMTINPKNVRPTEVSNHARSVITTNKPNPIPIDVRSKDRRFVVYQTIDKYLKKNKVFWTALYKHFRTKEFTSSLYQWFMSMDLTDFDWSKERPITKAYREMCNLYCPVEALFFEEYVDKSMWKEHEDFETKSSTDEITVPKSELFTQYEQFCKRNRFLKDDTKATSSRTFGSRIIELELPTSRIKYCGIDSIRFVPQEVYDHCDSRRWINAHRIDDEEAEVAELGEGFDEGYFVLN